MAAAVHLDTNVLIFGLSPAHPQRAQIRQWSRQGLSLAVSAMAWSEFLCGPVAAGAASAWRRVLSGGILPLDAEIAERAAGLFNATGRRARSLPDCLIAATAIHSGAPLATLNQADFKPLTAHGLKLL